jgi:hypothetical protein
MLQIFQTCLGPERRIGVLGMCRGRRQCVMNVAKCYREHRQVWRMSAPGAQSDSEAFWTYVGHWRHLKSVTNAEAEIYLEYLSGIHWGNTSEASIRSLCNFCHSPGVSIIGFNPISSKGRGPYQPFRILAISK